MRLASSPGNCPARLLRENHVLSQLFCSPELSIVTSPARQCKLNQHVYRSTFALTRFGGQPSPQRHVLANRSSLRSACCQAERLESEGWRIPGSNR